MNHDIDRDSTAAPRPLLAALLSTLLPGLGQIYAGQTRRGAWFLALSIVSAAGVAVFALQNPIAVSKLAFRPGVLTSLLVVDAVVLAWRVYTAADAYRISQGRIRLGGRATTAAMIGIAALLIVPHGIFAYYDLLQYNLITTVFASSDTTTTAPVSAAPATTEPVTTTTPGSTSSPQSTTTALVPTTTTTTTSPPTFWEGQERLNILLLGSDSGTGRTGVRTDTMAVVSIEPDSGHSAVFSIPRNMQRVPLPQTVGIWACDCYPDLLNGLYGYAERNPDAFPGPARPGANAIKGAISELLQIPVHYYALVSLDGFVDIIDAFGGVDITVAERIYDPAYPNEDGSTSVVDIQPGEYHFEGHDALIYARSRYSSDDYNRIGRQRCVIEAVADQASPIGILRNFPTIADALERSLETDIPLDQVPDLIDLIPLLNTDEVVSIPFVPPTYVAGRSAEGLPYPNTDLIREHVGIVMELPPLEALATLGLTPLAEACR